MSDFNAQIGSIKDGKHVGPLGLIGKNDREEKFLEFMKERELIISNMWFKMPQRRVYTWKSSNTQTRSQVDYNLILIRSKNSVHKIKNYPVG